MRKHILRDSIQVLALPYEYWFNARLPGCPLFVKSISPSDIHYRFMVNSITTIINIELCLI